MTPKPVIILEDLKVVGFDTMSKYMYTDYEVSKMIFKRLAKFHAASYFLHDEQVRTINDSSITVYYLIIPPF